MTPPILHKLVDLPAARADVWRILTDPNEAATGLCAKARIDLKMLGRYELLFDLDQPPGRQGSEGMRVLSYVPEAMLSFEWNAPPSFADERSAPAQTFVVMHLRDLPESGTRLEIQHLGWPQGGAWPQVYAYFDRAWDAVCTWLLHRFEVGAVDWSAPPRPSRSFAAAPG